MTDQPYLNINRRRELLREAEACRKEIASAKDLKPETVKAKATIAQYLIEQEQKLKEITALLDLPNPPFSV